MKQITVNVPDNATDDEIIHAVKTKLNTLGVGWVVIRDANKGESLGITHLAMVDRNKIKSTWWTSDNVSLMMVFRLKSAAIAKANNLNFGNTRVVSYEDAVRLITEQAESINEAEIENEIENDCGDYMYQGDS